MNIIMLGAPGAGKGTQAKKISELFKIPHISTGDIFRFNIKNNTELGKKAKEFIDNGLLVPDELVIDLVKDRLLDDDTKNGFIFDGFPRTIPQAEALSNADVKIDYAVDIECPDEVIVARISGRRACPSCGSIYHIDNNPPNTENICDKCGSELIHRNDDKPETVTKRLDVYHEQTQPLIEYYKDKEILRVVDGKASIDQAYDEIVSILEV